MQGASILLVEDDEVLRDIIRTNLQARGHEVSVANDVQSALAYLRSKNFDLVVLDINLPDQTGWEILRVATGEGYIHPQEVDGHKLPVVMLSGVHMSPRRLTEFHPLAYLIKPFPIEALLRLAAEAAERRNGRATYGTEKTAGPENPQSNEEDLYA
jgi:DNA-binding response OmpR family regulator